MAGDDGWQPLAGLTVVDFTMFVPGPFASATFADLGADVIKIEPPGGDPARRYIPTQFRTENRNKRSIVLDLKAAASRTVVERLAKRADVVLEGFRPGVAARLGIDYETLHAANVRLVYCSISGYGQSGPWRARPGHDVNYVAATGGLAFPGQWMHPPARSSLPIADMGGGLLAASVVLAALRERDRTARGVRLDLSLFESAFFWAAMRHGLAPETDPKAHIFPVNDVFECADGVCLTLGILEEHFWNNFVRCVAELAPDLGDEGYASDARRRANGDRLSARLAEVMKQKTAAEWERLLEAADVPADRCLTPAQAAELPQLVERGATATVKGERHALFPVYVNGHRGSALRRASPGLGEHSREILAEIGFDAVAIAELARAGVVQPS